MKELVLFKAYYNKYDAEMAAALLKNNGIEVLLQSDDAGGFRNHLTLGMGNNRLMIKKNDFDKALELIKTISEDLSDEELKEIEEIAVNTDEPSRPNKKTSEHNIQMIIYTTIGIVFLFSYVLQKTHSNKNYTRFSQNQMDCQGTPMHGVCREYYKSKSVRWIGNYKNNKFEGSSTEFYENGKIKEEWTYVNNQRNGPYKSYFENGVLSSEGYYKNDQFDGEIKDYYESGKIMSITHFKNGEIDGTQKNYFESGNLMANLDFKDGYRFDESGKRYEGAEKIYYEDGQLWSECYYKNGKLQGIMKAYYANGNLESEKYFHNGKINGIATGYFKNGQIQYETKVKKKVPIYYKEYNQEGDLIYESNY